MKLSVFSLQDLYFYFKKTQDSLFVQQVKPALSRGFRILLLTSHSAWCISQWSV